VKDDDGSLAPLKLTSTSFCRDDDMRIALHSSRRQKIMLDFSHLLLFFVFIPTASTAMTTKIRNGRMPSAAGRMELFFKSPSELKDRIRFLRSNGITSFNLVNKDKKDDMDTWIDSIREVYPEADISAHYSLKHNKVPRKGIEEHTELWLKNLEHSNADEILMISGGGDKKAWNAVEALKAVRNVNATNASANATATATATATTTVDTTFTSHPKIAVAYNPYFPSRHDREEENRRLIEKLATGCVSKIYLQFGIDMDRLQEGLEFIRKNTETSDVVVTVAGSLFLPTKKLIAQQKFRPWNGVFLSPDFLKGPEEATAIILEIMRVYKANGVEMLWEAPGVRTEKDIGMVRELLDAAAAGVVVGPLSERQHDNDNLVDTKGASSRSSPKRLKQTITGERNESRA
jgi:hypothetical protein